MKLINKYAETVVNNFVDTNSGEILDTSVEVKTHKVIIDSKEQFAFQYASIIGAMKNLTASDVKVLTYCSLKAEFNTNRICLTNPFLIDIERDMEISKSAIKHSIGKLTKLNILIKIGSGVYRVNPKYYWKGEGQERSKVMRYILEMECKDC